MKKTTLFVLLLILCASNVLRAQTFSLITGHEPVASLDGLWRFHTGDNPQWANPNFDDSQWPLLRSNESWSTQGYPGYGGYAWYRFTVQVPDGSKPYSLLLGQARTGYQVFLDGKFLGSYGNIGVPGYYVLNRNFAVPPSAYGPRLLHLAIRIWHNPRWVAGGGFYESSYIGDSQLMARRAAMARRLRMDKYVNDYTYAVLGTLVGLTVLVLFFIRRSEREYLWFALLLLANAAAVVWNMVYRTSPVTIDVFRFFGITLESAALFSALMFFSVVLRASRSKVWWVAAVLLAINPFTLAIEYFNFTSVGVAVGVALYLLCLVPASLWILGVLIQRSIQKDKNALLLLVPTLLWQGFQLINVILDMSWRFGMRRGNFHWTPLLLSPYRLMPS
ncbi:MAG TPA: beta galactosidase jelly roll domain-containing protein, partial [Acidobacteriaceae bacterium]|nr:beta galactosidase jelly roll domain-containing protein [Acidobacteriaceae bacterium]